MAAGVSQELVAFLAEATPRGDETPQQTAMRVAGLELAAGSGLLALATRGDIGGGTWWATDAEALKVLKAEEQRRRRLYEEQRAQVDFDYHFGPAKDQEALKAAGIEPGWANALLKPYLTLTDPHYNPNGRYTRNHSYKVTRVRNFDPVRHLTEVRDAGMSAEDYERFVTKTNLTWTQIPAWFAAKFTPDDLALFLGGDDWVADGFKGNATAAKRAAELTGSPARAARLLLLLRQWVTYDSRNDSWAGQVAEKLRGALGWSQWSRKDGYLASPKVVGTAWVSFVEAVGGGEKALRLLDLAAVVQPLVRGRQDIVGSVIGWEQTGLSVERVGLLIGAGIKSLEEAMSDATLALSDDQLAFAASMNH